MCLPVVGGESFHGPSGSAFRTFLSWVSMGLVRPLEIHTGLYLYLVEKPSLYKTFGAYSGLAVEFCFQCHCWSENWLFWT